MNRPPAPTPSPPLAASLLIVQPQADGSIAVPPPPAADPVAAAVAALQAEQAPGPDEVQALQARVEALKEQLDALQEVLNRPLSEILDERDRFRDAAKAWDAFGAMWVLAQRAMRRVAMDLAAQQGVSEAEVVRRAMEYANRVLNVEDEDLGGSLSEAQLAHIARHKAALRKQFRQG
ncbi:MAG: hypothetical protein ACK40S_09500 [Burkholderiaceae bacterium]